MRKLIPFLIILFIVAGMVYTGKLDFSKPDISINDVENIGKDYTLKIKLQDHQSGIGTVNVYISQNNKLASVYKSDSINDKELYLNIPINPQKLGLLEGKAVIKVEASNNALIKRKSTFEKEILIDLTPPTLYLVDWTKNIINGGTGFIFFKSSEPLKEYIVKVGGYKYNCLWFNFGYVCPFSIPYFEEQYLPIMLQVKDYAENIVNQSINYTLKKVNYNKSVLKIDDNFIENKIKPLSDKNIEDKVELFKYVNVEIRKKNEEVIHKVASECKNKEPLFEGYFSYLENSAKLGGFADYRKYSYNDKIIEGADAYHKGFDFASVKNAPVKASNNGIVVFTGFLGIYGNSVIIDHGLCVYSLYSHLDVIDVKPGQKVDKNTVIGKTGTTGLAVGDHLHFGILVNGIEINPIEWFDPKWLETRFYNPYKALKNSN